MSIIFCLLLLFSFVVFIIGLIRPTIIKLSSRKLVLYYMGGAVVLFFILTGITSPSVPQEKRNQDFVANQSTTTTSSPEATSTSSTLKPEVAYYQVVKVVDGDTVTLSIEGKNQTVRLIGINTPETVDPRKPVECFGKEASDKAKDLLEGRSVRIEKDASQGDYDKYNRMLVYIFLENGTDFNKYMIEQGYAYEYTYDLPYKYQKEFKDAQKIAQNAKRGLWATDACEITTTKPSITNTQPTSIENKPQTSNPTQSSKNSQYICSKNAYNCSDFKTQAEAQSVFEACGGINNDIHQLDRDKDSRVCETLP